MSKHAADDPIEDGIRQSDRHDLGMDGYCFTCQRMVCIHGLRDYIEPSTGVRWRDPHALTTPPHAAGASVDAARETSRTADNGEGK